jgi:hypothetical protein
LFDETHYVPIVKAKRGEMQALGQASNEARQGLTPLIEAPFLDAADAEEGTITPVLRRLPGILNGACGHERPFFLDLGLVASEPALANGEHPVEHVFSRTREQGLLAIPVTDLRRDQGFQDAIDEVVAADGRGLCVRLDPEDFDDIDAALDEVDEFMARRGLTPQLVDLVLDFGDIEPRQAGSLGLVAAGLISPLRHLLDWRTLTLAATSFPRVADFGAESINTAPRAEWALWDRLRSRGLPRVPTFSDYGITGTQTGEPGTASMFAPSPNLRYSTESDYLIYKARHPRHGYDQFNALCAQLVSRPEYRGEDFSAGDGYIGRCARGTDGPGNAAKWLEAGTSHHLAVVTTQLATP